MSMFLVDCTSELLAFVFKVGSISIVDEDGLCSIPAANLEPGLTRSDPVGSNCELQRFVKISTVS